MSSNIKLFVAILLGLCIGILISFIFSPKKRCGCEDFTDIVLEKNNNDWLDSARNLKISRNVIEVELPDGNGNWKYNNMEVHPALLNKKLINDHGLLKYILTKEENNIVREKLFPKYKGPTLPDINIKKCVMLSVNIEKYNKARNETIRLLNEYKIPPITVFYGYTSDNIKTSKFGKYMKTEEGQRDEVAVGMLEAFENFVNESNGKNEWMFYCEDDVRVVNLDKSTDLTKLYNVPVDAELIRPYIGKNEKCKLQDLTYYVSYGGGMNHAIYISTEGCKKVVNYAKKYGWKYVCDIDIYKIAKFCGNYPTDLDGYSLASCNGVNTISDKLNESEKVVMYHLSNTIFDQTSLPVT
jgi:hypothetical protein